MKYNRGTYRVERDFTQRKVGIGTPAVILFVVVAAVAYWLWLNAGCDPVGVMTWQGKVCYQDLPTRI